MPLQIEPQPPVTINKIAFQLGGESFSASFGAGVSRKEAVKRMLEHLRLYAGDDWETPDAQG